MALSNLAELDKKNLKLILFCGKGGVGKTTCSAATALHYSDKGLKTFLISSDPAPSLSDIFEMKFGSLPVKVNDHLDVVELNHDHIIEMWKEKFGGEISEVISSFLPVGEEILDYIAGAPGIDEEFMLSYIYDIFNGCKYDLIVWDTAPAGGTLRLIKLEEKFYNHLGEAGKLYLRIRSSLDRLSGGKKKSPLKIIEEWKELAGNTLDMLKDRRTEATVVTIPEALGVFQTERIIKDLNGFGIQVDKIVINHVLKKDICDCQFHVSRREMQRKYIDILTDLFGNERLALLHMRKHEVKGMKAIQDVSNHLFGKEEVN